MANIPTATRVLVVLLVVFMMLMRFEAAPIHTELDKRLLLSKVLNAKSRLMEFHGRRMSISESATDRLSPEGPNHEHHSHPPGNP
ncbi:hypothetical protein Peur_062917 [Populus x canadensis]|jgi:hypothetical protein